MELLNEVVRVRVVWVQDTGMVCEDAVVIVDRRTASLVLSTTLINGDNLCRIGRVQRVRRGVLQLESGTHRSTCTLVSIATRTVERDLRSIDGPHLINGKPVEGPAELLDLCLYGSLDFT
jgi:hypothetical protein